MNRWEVKQSESKEYKSSLGKTDYNIPMIGYKGALLICIVIFLAVMIVPSIMNESNRLVVLSVCSIIIGTTISYAQYFIHSKKGFTKSFITVTIALIVLIWLLLITL